MEVNEKKGIIAMLSVDMVRLPFHPFLSLFSEGWVATGAPTKGSYQTVPFLIEEA
jgi:hypothetical protein